MIDDLLWDFAIFSGLFLFYAGSVLYANWSGYTRGFEAGKSVRKEPVDPPVT